MAAIMKVIAAQIRIRFKIPLPNMAEWPLV
jgi:hypothetical protein